MRLPVVMLRGILSYQLAGPDVQTSCSDVKTHCFYLFFGVLSKESKNKCPFFFVPLMVGKREVLHFSTCRADGPNDLLR